MAVVPPPVRLPPRLPPDRDFDDIRAAAVAIVASDSGTTWTDHNLSDPGITFLEVIAWGLADLHYRAADHGFELAPLEVPRWLDRAERDWCGMPDLDDPERVVALGTLMATRVPAGTGPPEVGRMADIVSGSDSRRSAIRALVDQAFGSPPQQLAWDEAAVVVSLVRARRLRRAALDHSDTLAAMSVEARRTVQRLAPGSTVDEGDVDDEVVRLLRFHAGFAGLWEDELRTLIRRHRHRMFLGKVAGILPSLGPSAHPTLSGIHAELDISAEEARAVLALHPCPPGELPEAWEADDGTSTTWPPHPLQALTTEPVTAEDYATRARGVTRVRRAWTVSGALAGIAWDGSVRADPIPGRAGAVTVLVEFDPASSSAAEQRTLMREVLAFLTAGEGEVAEVDLPYDALTAPHLQVPRRVMCDELGIAIVRECPVTLNGTLHVALGADRATVLNDALGRVRAWFAAGRTESAVASQPVPTCPSGIEGPWPPAPQPEGGWMPGEAIRLHELVQVLAADPTVIGVDGVEARIDGEWHAIALGGIEAPLAPDCMPVLADTQCLDVRLELGADCHD